MPKLRRTPEQKANDDFIAYVLRNQRQRKITQTDIGQMLNLSHTAVGKRLDGVTRWKLIEMAILVDEFGEPFTIGVEK